MRRRLVIEAGLKEVEKKLGTLANPPSWVGTAILINESMKKEVAVVTAAVTALDKVKPLSCNEAVVSQLEDVQLKALADNVKNVAVEKVSFQIQ